MDRYIQSLKWGIKYGEPKLKGAECARAGGAIYLMAVISLYQRDSRQSDSGEALQIHSRYWDTGASADDTLRSYIAVLQRMQTGVRRTRQWGCHGEAWVAEPSIFYDQNWENQSYDGERIGKQIAVPWRHRLIQPTKSYEVTVREALETARAQCTMVMDIARGAVDELGRIDPDKGVEEKEWERGRPTCEAKPHEKPRWSLVPRKSTSGDSAAIAAWYMSLAQMSNRRLPAAAAATVNYLILVRGTNQISRVMREALDHDVAYADHVPFQPYHECKPLTPGKTLTVDIAVCSNGFMALERCYNVYDRAKRMRDRLTEQRDEGPGRLKLVHWDETKQAAIDSDGLEFPDGQYGPFAAEDLIVIEDTKKSLARTAKHFEEKPVVTPPNLAGRSGQATAGLTGRPALATATPTGQPRQAATTPTGRPEQATAAFGTQPAQTADGSSGQPTKLVRFGRIPSGL
jgi:hypothetical protein